MSLSKTLTTTVAALTIAGAVGMAYAQTTNNDSGRVPAPASADTSQPVSNTAPASTATTPMDTATPSTSTDLEPKADRN